MAEEIGRHRFEKRYDTPCICISFLTHPVWPFFRFVLAGGLDGPSRDPRESRYSLHAQRLDKARLGHHHVLVDGGPGVLPRLRLHLQRQQVNATFRMKHPVTYGSFTFAASFWKKIRALPVKNSD